MATDCDGRGTLKRTLVKRLLNDNTNIIWMDLEFTNLDPRKGKICELGCFITDCNLKLLHDLKMGPDVVIQTSAEDLKIIDEDKWIKDTFTENGLFEALRTNGKSEGRTNIPMKQAEAECLAFIKQFCPEGKCRLAGNSIHGDKKWLEFQMPTLNKFLNYRILDVSSVSAVLETWLPEIYALRPKKKKLHRAMEDTKESLEELQYYKSVVLDRVGTTIYGDLQLHIAKRAASEALGDDDLPPAKRARTEQAECAPIPETRGPFLEIDVSKVPREPSGITPLLGEDRGKVTGAEKAERRKLDIPSAAYPDGLICTVRWWWIKSDGRTYTNFLREQGFDDQELQDCFDRRVPLDFSRVEKIAGRNRYEVFNEVKHELVDVAQTIHKTLAAAGVKTGRLQIVQQGSSIIGCSTNPNKGDRWIANYHYDRAGGSDSDYRWTCDGLGEYIKLKYKDGTLTDKDKHYKLKNALDPDALKNSKGEEEGDPRIFDLFPVWKAFVNKYNKLIGNPIQITTMWDADAVDANGETHPASGKLSWWYRRPRKWDIPVIDHVF